MGFMDKFKGFMGVPEDEYLDDDEDPDYDKDYDEDEPEEDSRPIRQSSKVRTSGQQEPIIPSRAVADKVVNLHSGGQYQVVVVKPERFEDASSIADHLIAKRTVLLNLEAVTPDLKRRLVDFLSGVAYTNGGQIKPVANSTYIITPCNVGVMGESMTDEMGNNGVYF